MNLVRAHLGRRKLARPQFVPFLAVGQLGQPDAVAAVGQVGVREVLVELAVGGQHRVFDDIPCLGAEPRHVVFADRIIVRCENPVERTVFCVVDKLDSNLVRDAFHQNFRRNETVFTAGFSQGNCLLDDDVNLAEPGQPVFVVFDCRKAQLARIAVDVLYATALVERDQVAVERKLVDTVLQRPPKQFMI